MNPRQSVLRVTLKIDNFLLNRHSKLILCHQLNLQSNRESHDQSKQIDYFELCKVINKIYYYLIKLYRHKVSLTWNVRYHKK